MHSGNKVSKQNQTIKTALATHSIAIWLQIAENRHGDERGDVFEKRRRLMADWANYCAAGGAGKATVTPIRGIAA